MTTKAAIAWRVSAPLVVDEVDLEGLRVGEALNEAKAKGLAATALSVALNSGAVAARPVDTMADFGQRSIKSSMCGAVISPLRLASPIA